MLAVSEQEIQSITEAIRCLLRGRIPPAIAVPEGPRNELTGLIEHANALIAAHSVSSDFALSLSRGDLSVDLPRGGLRLTQSLKNLQANLRHLTWKTQQVAQGDFSERIDFMGDFSAAFNSMVEQLAAGSVLLREKIAAE